MHCYAISGGTVADCCPVGAFIGTYTFPSIVESLGGAGTYGGDTVRFVSMHFGAAGADGVRVCSGLDRVSLSSRLSSL